MGFLSGDMVATEAKKKKPPTFHYLPKSRGKHLCARSTTSTTLTLYSKATQEILGRTSQDTKQVEGTEDKGRSDNPDERTHRGRFRTRP